MRQKKVWRYYCDYCKKSGCSKYWIQRHEESCTMNPNRTCKVHKNYIGEPQPDMADLKAIIEKHCKGLTPPCDDYLDEDDYDHSVSDEFCKAIVDDLLDASDGCPVCVLSAIRRFTPDGWRIGYNFKKQMDEFWGEYNVAELEREGNRG